MLKSVSRETGVIAGGLVLITLLRVLQLYFWPFDLFFDEAQYWGWAKALDFGYYSKPPVVAWLIAITTGLIGDGEFAIRFSSALVHLLTAAGVYQLGKTLYNEKTGAWSAITYLTLPAVSVSSMLVSTDPALLCAWAWGMVCFIRAAESNQPRWWLLTGLITGLGLLSKYTMVMFAPSAVLYLCLSREGRAVFFKPQLWLASAVAFLVFLPNILWNARNHFASFLHTKDNANLAGPLLHPEKLLEFFGAQFGVFGPMLFAVLLYVLIYALWKSKVPKADRTLAVFIMPLLLLIVLVSLLSRAHANWAAPVYVPASVLVVAFLLERGKKHWLIASLVLHIVAAAVFAFLPQIVTKMGYRFAAHTNLTEHAIKDPFLRLRGWKEMGRQVAEIAAAHPGATLLTLDRDTHAELLYYAQPYGAEAIKFSAQEHIADHYDLTTDMAQAKEDKYLLVTRWEAKGVLKHFRKAQKLPAVNVPVYEDFSRTYQIFLLEGFKGYE